MPSTSTPAPPGPPAEATSPPPPPKSSGGPNRCRRSSVRGAVTSARSVKTCSSPSSTVAGVGVGTSSPALTASERVLSRSRMVSCVPSQTTTALSELTDVSPPGWSTKPPQAHAWAGAASARAMASVAETSRSPSNRLVFPGSPRSRERSERLRGVVISPPSLARVPAGRPPLAWREAPHAAAPGSPHSWRSRVRAPVRPAGCGSGVRTRSSGSSTSARTPHGRPRSPAPHQVRSRGT